MNEGAEKTMGRKKVDKGIRGREKSNLEEEEWSSVLHCWAFSACR